MASKRSTNISLLVLGFVSICVIGYFVWMFLAPPPRVAVVSQTIQTDIQTGVVSSDGFQALQPYASLPVKAVNVGRINPFDPVITAPAGSTTTTEPTNSPKAPLINANENVPPPIISNTNTP